MRPYTPLELAGRNIYIREGCYLCHSQMIRPFRDEVERYGHYQPGGGKHVRPSVPVGLQADRPGPGPRRPALFRMNGMFSTWLIHAPSCRNRSCRAYPFLAAREVRVQRYR